MKFGIVTTTVITLAVFLSASSLAATPDKAAAHQAAASTATNRVVSNKPQKGITAPKAKLVDINSAKKEELKTLPGIGDAQAEKIMAGRPYGSKAHLITRNIVEREIYNNINQLVVAKPTRQLLDKVAALNKKKE